MFYILNVCKKDPEKSQRTLINLDRKIKKKEIMHKRLKVMDKNENKI